LYSYCPRILHSVSDSESHFEQKVWIHYLFGLAFIQFNCSQFGRFTHFSSIYFVCIFGLKLIYNLRNYWTYYNRKQHTFGIWGFEWFSKCLVNDFLCRKVLSHPSSEHSNNCFICLDRMWVLRLDSLEYVLPQLSYVADNFVAFVWVDILLVEIKIK